MRKWATLDDTLDLHGDRIVPIVTNGVTGQVLCEETETV